MMCPVLIYCVYQSTKEINGMYIAHVNNIRFNGTTKYLTCEESGRYKRISNYSYGSANFGDTRGLTEFVKRHTLPFANVEELVGKLHKEATYKIYITDPMETVNDLIRRQHDYIVYDVEPKIQNFKKYYFDSDKESLKAGFKNILEYFKRLTTTVNNIQNIYAQNTLNHAQNCIGIFENVCEKIEEISELKEKIDFKKELLKSAKLDTPIFENERIKKQQTIKNHEASLSGKLKRYAIWLERRHLLNQSGKKTSDKVENVEKNIKRYEASISVLEAKIDKLKKRIEYLDQYIEKAPEQILKYQSEIQVMEALLKIKEGALLPILEKLNIQNIAKRI